MTECVSSQVVPRKRTMTQLPVFGIKHMFYSLLFLTRTSSVGHQRYYVPSIPPVVVMLARLSFDIENLSG